LNGDKRTIMHHEEVSDMNDICRQPGIERNKSGGMRIMSRRARVGDRRGNTLVLVAAVLALLAIIATAYVTRTQSQRMVSVAQQQASMRGENIDHIAESLAEHIALSLFVQPIDTTDPAMHDANNDFFPHWPASSNYPRLKPRTNATRYGIDQQWLDLDGDGVPERVTFGYNHAPYHTVPFTNWPTPQTLQSAPYNFTPQEAVEMLPPGPGNPGNPFDPDPNAPIPGADNLAHAFESNPMGNPGFGDQRWLADTEPVRWFPTGSD
jgi:type II secretory pathway pseudopilin PulG